MTTATLPSYTTQDKSTDKDRRSIRYRWTLGTLGNGDSVIAELAVLHHPNGKVYGASVNRLVHTPPRDGSVFSTDAYEPMRATLVRRVPAARYSAKDLAAFGREVVQQVIDGAYDSANAYSVHFAPVGAQDESAS